MRRAIPEFLQGFATLGRGFALWRRRPGLMALGLVPAGIVAALLVTGIVLLGVFLDPITEALTFYAGSWDGGWRNLLRLAIAVGLVIGTLALAARTFTAVTLLVGTPFYDRIQRVADDDRGAVAEVEPGFWRMTAATIVLVLRSLLASLLVVLLGLVPVVGTVLATVVGFVLTASALTRELTLNPLARRGILGRARREAFRGSRARALGFGIAVQLCYLVPFGAVVTMPAAVAGSSLLVRDVLHEPGGRAAGAADGVSASAG